MNSLWDIIVSPMGIVLYAGFWAFKLTAGVWLVTKAVTRLPVRHRIWAEAALIRLRLMKGPADPLG
ncbi:hypothetical protein J4E08_20015 [Sagittula sp. NFXS13]|uniref:hypothetical protein n=1 Tax=Sagittula sp. NFXS13 TaxID=2819095 RepID=UPI0032DFACF3